MLAVSERWAPTVASSHAVAHRVEVWRGGELLVPDLPASGGSAVRDAGSAITLSASVEVADPAYLPVDPADPLMPFGSELRIYLGVKHPGNVEELVQVFSGPIVSVPTWPSGGAGFTVRAEGWLRYVADDRFLAPFAPTGPTLAAIGDLLSESVPGAPLAVDPGISDAGISGSPVYEENRLEALEALAGSLGGVVREDPAGGFVLAPDLMPDPGAAPVRSFIHGEGNTMLEGSEPDMERSERYNGVVAYNPEDDAVRAVATIDDPENPTRWGGPFGRRTLYYASPLLTAGTVEQAARTRLDGLQGRVRKITAAIAPDPSLEPGDHVLVRWPRTAGSPVQVEELAMIRRVEHPIGPGKTKIEMRGTS